MVQRMAAPTKVAHPTESNRSTVTAEKQDPKRRDGCGEVNRKMRKTKSLRSKAIANRSPPKVAGVGPAKPSITGAKPPTGKVSRGSPNYMKATSSWDARKEGMQVTAHSSAITVSPESSKVTNHSSRLKPSPSPSSSTYSSSGINSSPRNARKPLARKASLRLRRPSMKKSSVMALSSKKIVDKATCSSTLKDSKFQKALDLNPGATEAERTSVMRVCPFNYCSLNGHRHAPATPLKRFLSARRRSLKAQKSMRVKRKSSTRKLSFRKGNREERDAGKRSLSRVKSKITPLIEDMGMDSCVQVYAEPTEHVHKFRSIEDAEDQDELEEEISRILRDLCLMDDKCGFSEGETTEYDGTDSLDDIAEVCSLISSEDADINTLDSGSKEENLPLQGLMQEGWGVECCGVNVLEIRKKCMSDSEDSIISDSGDKAEPFPDLKSSPHLMTDTLVGTNDLDYGCMVGIAPLIKEETISSYKGDTLASDGFNSYDTDHKSKDEERIEVDKLANCNVNSFDLLDHPSEKIFLDISVHRPSSEAKEFGDQFKAIKERTLSNNQDKSDLSQCRLHTTEESECFSGAEEDNGVITGSSSAAREVIVHEESIPVVVCQSQDRINLMLSMEKIEINDANAEAEHGIGTFRSEKCDLVNINLKTDTDNETQKNMATETHPMMEIESPELFGINLDKPDITSADKAPGQIKPDVSSENDESDDTSAEDDFSEGLHNINLSADAVNDHKSKDRSSTKGLDSSDPCFGVTEINEEKALAVDRCNFNAADVDTGNVCLNMGSEDDQIQKNKTEHDSSILVAEFCGDLVEGYDKIQEKQNTQCSLLNGVESASNINPNANFHKEFADHNAGVPIMKSRCCHSFYEEFETDNSKLFILDTCNLVTTDERPKSSKLCIGSMDLGNNTAADNEIIDGNAEDIILTRELEFPDTCYEAYKEEKEKPIISNNHSLFTANEISDNTDLIVLSEDAEDKNSKFVTHHDWGRDLQLNMDIKEYEISGGKGNSRDETPNEEIEAPGSPSKAYIALQDKHISVLECDSRDDINIHAGSQDDNVEDCKAEDENIMSEIHCSESYYESSDQVKLEVRPQLSEMQIKDNEYSDADLSADIDSLLDDIEHSDDIYSESDSMEIRQLGEDKREVDDSLDLEHVLSVNIGIRDVKMVSETMIAAPTLLEENIKKRAKHRIMRRRTRENVEAVKLINPRAPRFLTVEPDPDAEKVDLRHQMMDERKNSEAWMIDHALQKVVRKLAPARKRKVALLVEAFEAVIPPSFCESPLQSPASSFARPVQACF